MTIRAYISDKLKAFGISEAQFADISAAGIDLDAEYSGGESEAVGKALVSVMEELTLAPRVSNVSESGFSMSWDYGELGKYYLWLCKKYGVEPNDDVLSMLGVSMITDRTNLW